MASPHVGKHVGGIDNLEEWYPQKFTMYVIAKKL